MVSAHGRSVAPLWRSESRSLDEALASRRLTDRGRFRRRTVAARRPGGGLSGRGPDPRIDDCVSSIPSVLPASTGTPAFTRKQEGECGRREMRGSTPGQGVDSRRMSEGANAELIRRVFAEANRVAEVGGLDASLDLLSEEIVWEAVEDAPDAGTYRGHEGIRGYLEDWLETVDGFHNELRGLTELGAGVVADVRFSGRIKGTDNEMTFDYSQASLIEDGKVARVKEFREHDDAVAWVKDSEPRGS